MSSTPFPDLNALAQDLRSQLDTKKFILLYAYNGTGKTRLSMDFKDLGKQGEGDEEKRDTLYFNAFTEDLFTWDNDIKQQDDDPDETLYGRIVNILSHGNYSFYDPVEMLPENKAHFEKILADFLEFYPFNSELMPTPPKK